MPCCLRLLAISVAPSTSLMVSPLQFIDLLVARLCIDGRGAKGRWVQPSHASGLWTAAERCDPAVECLNIPGLPSSPSPIPFRRLPPARPCSTHPSRCFPRSVLWAAPRVPSGTRGPGAGWIINGDAPMTRISAVVLIAAVALACAPTMSSAQNAASPRGTNSAGTAQSSGAAPNAQAGGRQAGSAPAKPSRRRRRALMP